jgi:hypothetical protein
MITREEKNKQIEKVERNSISLYYLKEYESEIKKGDIKINVLYTLLIEEINKHNGVIRKKANSIRNQGTCD